jgi:hypothetical protein
LSFYKFKNIFGPVQTFWVGPKRFGHGSKGKIQYVEKSFWFGPILFGRVKNWTYRRKKNGSKLGGGGERHLSGTQLLQNTEFTKVEK